jgi:hypothetical protein
MPAKPQAQRSMKSDFDTDSDSDIQKQKNAFSYKRQTFPGSFQIHFISKKQGSKHFLH